MSGEYENPSRRGTRPDVRFERTPRRITQVAPGECLTAAKLNELVRATNQAGSNGNARQLQAGERPKGVYEARVIEEFNDFIECELFEGTDQAERIVVAKPYLLRATPHSTMGRGNEVLTHGGSFAHVEDLYDPGKRDASGGDHLITPAYVPRDISKRYLRTTSFTSFPDQGQVDEWPPPRDSEWDDVYPWPEEWAEYPGDLLYVTNAVDRIDLFYSSGFEDEQAGTAPEHWLDLNVDGRRWVTQGSYVQSTYTEGAPGFPGPSSWLNGEDPGFEAMRRRIWGLEGAGQFRPSDTDPSGEDPH